MIQMYFTPGGKVCNKLGRKFVNDRLIDLMEDLMAEYAQMGDDSYMAHIKSSKEWEAPLETVIDLNRMRNDIRFAKNWLIEMEYVPDSFAPDRALHDFWSLYDLLKAEKEYKPDLSMEYILYYIIEYEKDLCKDMPDLHERRKHIAEPIRSIMMEELKEEAADIQEQDPETYEESIPEIAEDLMACYEDLDQYIETCFEDTDCLFLNEMNEKELEESGLVEAMGINIKGDETQVKIEIDGQQFEYSVPAWEAERIKPCQGRRP